MADILDGFKISSASARLSKSPAAVVKIKAVLEKIPDDELLTTRQLAAAAGYSQSYTKGHLPDEALLPFRCKIQSRLYWGNAKTIQKLKQRLKNVHQN